MCHRQFAERVGVLCVVTVCRKGWGVLSINVWFSTIDRTPWTPVRVFMFGGGPLPTHTPPTPLSLSHHPDMIFAVDWALKTNALSYLSLGAQDCCVYMDRSHFKCIHVMRGEFSRRSVEKTGASRSSRMPSDTLCDRHGGLVVKASAS